MKKYLKRKPVLVIVIAVLLVIIPATTVWAADSAPTPTTSITIIGPDEKITIESPFIVTRGAMSVNPAKTKNGTYFAGETVASVPVTVTNVGRMDYSISINVLPAEILEGNSYPILAVSVKEGTDAAYPLWQIGTISPGERREMTIEISIAYHSQLVSFRGIILEIWPGPAERAKG